MYLGSSSIVAPLMVYLLAGRIKDIVGANQEMNRGGLTLAQPAQAWLSGRELIAPGHLAGTLKELVSANRCTSQRSRRCVTRCVNRCVNRGARADAR